jgi:hypothetical protein
MECGRQQLHDLHLSDIPVGAYESTRLANIGVGHSAVDGGAGYTYLDQKAGHEISGVLGFTYNSTNPSTLYKNGVDMHFDWGASQFVTKQLQIGVVGYLYDEIGCDSGSGDRVGCFQSRVVGVGPQLGRHTHEGRPCARPALSHHLRRAQNGVAPARAAGRRGRKFPIA